MVGCEGKSSHPEPQPDYITNESATLSEKAIEEINAEIERWYELIDVEYVASSKHKSKMV